MQTLKSTVLAEGFTYGEGPRWRDGMFWFSDMHADAVRTLDADGALGLGAARHHPSGIGWTPDGDLLVTSLEHAVLHRITPDGPQVHCDLSEFGPSLNDMVALPDGRVYVDVYTKRGGGPPNGDIALVAPDGTARIVAKGPGHPERPGGHAGRHHAGGRRDLRQPAARLDDPGRRQPHRPAGVRRAR